MKNKVCKIVAWSVAGVVLGGALVYYNFIDKAKVSDMQGKPCPDFVAKEYVCESDTFTLTDNEFVLSEKKGKIVLVNFWYTTCEGCLKEMHYFDELKDKYAASLEVIAIADTSVDWDDEVYEFLNSDGWRGKDPDHDWKDFSITFGRNKANENLFTDLGGSGAYPYTVLVDREGVIAYTTYASQTIYTDLEAQILDLL